MSTALGGGDGGGNSGGNAGGSAAATSGAGNSAGTASGGDGGNAAAVAAQASGGATAVGGGSGGAPANWRDSLPDDLKNDPTLSKFSDVPNLSKAYVELQKKIGQKGIIKPSATSSPEEWKAFREALGVPAADKYEVAIPKDITFPKESMEWAKKTFAEIGVLPEDASKVMIEYAKLEQARDAVTAEQKKEATKQGLDGLRKEWGEGYDKEIGKAHFAAKELLGQEFIDHLNKTGMGNDPYLIKAMAKAAALMGEDKLREGNLGDGRQTNDELSASIAEVRNQLMTMTQTDGRRPGLLARFESLNKQVTGGR